MTVASARGRYKRESVTSQYDDSCMEIMIIKEAISEEPTKTIGTAVNREIGPVSDSLGQATVPIPHMCGTHHLQYMPNTPKKPVRPRAISSERTSLIPNGKCSVFLYHMYKEEHSTVIPILANRIWNG